MLEPHSDEEAVREALRDVTGLVSGGDGSEGDEVSKSMERIEGQIDELRKAESDGPPGASVARERLEGAHRELQSAHLMRRSGYPGSTEARADAARRAM